MKRITFLSVILISLVGLYKTLSFAINGDDWLALYRYLKDFTTFGSHFYLANYNTLYTNYTFANIIMGIIYRLFGFNQFYYYLISLVLRTVAAFSFYPAVLSATKSKPASFLSSILFAAMFTGIETTNWVFNMNTYVSIFLFNLFLYFYFTKEAKQFYKSISIALILGVSFIITPNRMHGLLLIIPFLVLLKTSRIKNLLLFYTSVLLFRFTLNASNNDVYPVVINNLKNEWDNTLRSLLGSIGNILLPDAFYTYFKVPENSKILLAGIFLFTLSMFFYKASRKYREGKFGLLSLLILPAFLAFPILVFDPNITFSSDHRYLLIPGAYFLVALSIFISILLKNKNKFYKFGGLALALAVFLLNFISTTNYFNYLSEKGRLVSDSEKQFSFIKSQIEEPANDKPLVFLFVSDDPFYLYNAITFGFPYQMMLTDSRFALDIKKAPFPVDDMESLINVLSGPESTELNRYGYEPMQIPLENVYVLSLENKTLKNTTTQTREYLRKSTNSENTAKETSDTPLPR